MGERVSFALRDALFEEGRDISDPVTLEYLANELFVKAGVPERVTLSLFLPLVRATLDNLAAQGPADALTGPLSRGDTATIAAHLEALATQAPDALPVYRVLGEATLELVTARNEVDASVVARMRELLRVRL